MSRESASEKTALVVARTVWRWGGWIVGTALAATARGLLSRSGGSEMVEAAIEAAGTFLMVGGIGLLAVWCIYHGWRCLPAQRLGVMAPDLLNATTAFYDGRKTVTDTIRGKHSSRVVTVARRLDRLKVPRPSLDQGGYVWFPYLHRLVGEAEAAAITEARAVWAEMQKEAAADQAGGQSSG